MLSASWAKPYLLGFASLAHACAEVPVPTAAPPSVATVTFGAAPCRYDVTAGPGAEELRVQVDLPRGTSRLAVAAQMSAFVDEVAVSLDGGERWASVSRAGTGARVPACTEGGCRVRYRVDLAGAARELDDQDLALAHRGAFVVPPSSFLVTPNEVPAGARYELTVHTPPGTAFVSGAALGPGSSGAYAGLVADLDDAPYAAFSPLEARRFERPMGSLDLALTTGELTLPRAEIERWVEAQVDALTAYYGRFPIPHAALIVLLDRGRGVHDGRTTGNGGGSILLSLGEQSTTSDLLRDWVLVHEMVHLSFPCVQRPWAEEGLATYLEPIIRARAGLLDADRVWGDLIAGLPQGQPGPGDLGLDHTDTWGRRYWGGAAFWLLADVTIRQQSGGARSLDDALRHIVALGGNVTTRWSLDRALEEGDRATGGTALRDLRRRLGAARETVDLEGLWRELGVKLVGGRVAYDDGAPLAAARRQITVLQRGRAQ
jgi:hypothetical protein